MKKNWKNIYEFYCIIIMIVIVIYRETKYDIITMNSREYTSETILICMIICFVPYVIYLMIKKIWNKK